MRLGAYMGVVTMWAGCALGQAGLYGPVTARPKAGDAAPGLRFEKALRSPEGSSWSDANLTGRMTVLGFFPDTTDNLETVTQWNAAVDRSAGKQVQFVWITGEKEEKLRPWLADHPIKGWVLEDAAGKTGNAYGMEIPEEVIVGADGKIAGFFQGASQAEQMVRAVQEGRATTTRPTKATMRAFVAQRKVLLDAEPRRMPRPEEHRPDFAPSYVLHVTRTDGDEHSDARAGDFWSLRGYTVQEAFEEIFGYTAARMQMPTGPDLAGHFNFELVLPGAESREKMRERMRSGLLEHFHLTAAAHSRSMDVYVLTAVYGRLPPAPKTRGGGSAFELESIVAPGEKDEWKPVHLDAVRGVTSDGTMAEFCQQFEAQLDRPVVDETRLVGPFDVSIQAGEENRNDFLERLRNEAALVLTPAQREVEVLVVELAAR